MPKKLIALRIEEDIIKELKLLADKNSRSQANMVEVIIKEREKTNKMLELLQVSLNAFNDIPNRSVNIKGYKDTYQIASAIGKLLRSE